MDKCPICDSLTRISKVEKYFKNDTTPDKPTELWQHWEQICANNNHKNGLPCDNYNKVIDSGESKIM